MDIVDRIGILAKKNGWSRSEVFRRIGLNQAAAYDWRNGKSLPDKHIPKLVELLNTTEAYLRGETDDPAPNKEKTPTVNGEGEVGRSLSKEEYIKLVDTLPDDLVESLHRIALSIVGAIPKETE